MTVVDTLILRKITNKPNARISYATAPLKYPAYRELLIGNGIIGLIAWWFIIFAITANMFHILIKLLDDKTSRIREKYKIMGLKDTAYFSAYFIYYAIIQLIISFGCPLIFKWTIFPNTNFLILVLFFFVAAISIFPYAILIKYFYIFR